MWWPEGGEWTPAAQKQTHSLQGFGSHRAATRTALELSLLSVETEWRGWSVEGWEMVPEHEPGSQMRGFKSLLCNLTVGKFLTGSD